MVLEDVKRLIFIELWLQLCSKCEVIPCTVLMDHSVLGILGKQKSADVGRKKKNSGFDSGAGSSCECQTEQDCRYGGAIRKLITDSYLLYCIHASVLKEQHDDPVLKTLGMEI